MGLRLGEVCGLRWSDVDLDTSTLAVQGQYVRVDGVWTWMEPKTESSRRTLMMPEFVITALRAHRTR